MAADLKEEIGCYIYYVCSSTINALHILPCCHPLPILLSNYPLDGDNAGHIEANNTLTYMRERQLTLNGRVQKCLPLDQDFGQWLVHGFYLCTPSFSQFSLFLFLFSFSLFGPI